MTFVVELRVLKNSLPRPITDLWLRAASALCVVRVRRLACLGLLAVTLAYPVDGGAASHDSVLAMLCAVLTAAVSATTGLLCDATSDVLALFSDSSNTALSLQQSLSPCFAEPIFPLDICPATGTFPAFSGGRAWALVAGALFLFGSGFGRRGPAKQCAKQ